MAVYSISFDIYNYPYLQESTLQRSIQNTENDIRDLNGESQKGSWSSIDLDWFYDNQDQSNGLPDIAIWRATEFACSEKALPFIKSVAGHSCEFLPLMVNGEQWYAINVIRDCDAIDKDKTVFNFRRDGRPDRIRRFKKLVFKEYPIKENAINRVDGVGLVLFCSNEFYHCIIGNGLKGLVFTEFETD